VRKADHRRKYETFDKFSFYMAGFLFTALMGYQASLLSDQVQYTRDIAKTNESQQSDISSIVTRLGTVIENQKNLQETVSDVERKIIHICAKSEGCN